MQQVEWFYTTADRLNMSSTDVPFLGNGALDTSTSGVPVDQQRRHLAGMVGKGRINIVIRNTEMVENDEAPSTIRTVLMMKMFMAMVTGTDNGSKSGNYGNGGRFEQSDGGGESHFSILILTLMTNKHHMIGCFRETKAQPSHWVGRG